MGGCYTWDCEKCGKEFKTESEAEKHERSCKEKYGSAFLNKHFKELALFFFYIFLITLVVAYLSLFNDTLPIFIGLGLLFSSLFVLIFAISFFFIRKKLMFLFSIIGGLFLFVPIGLFFGSLDESYRYFASFLIFLPISFIYVEIKEIIYFMKEYRKNKK